MMAPLNATDPGYISPAFGESYRIFGEVLRLPRTGLQLLKRPIIDRAYDLIGVYPYAMCADWSLLNQDVDDLRESDAVSLVFVADPFQTERVHRLTKNWELSKHFKTHYVVDLKLDWHQARRKEERRLTRRALENHSMRVVADPVALAPVLWDLYQTTLERKQVTGMQRLSLTTIQQQLAVPGAVLVTAEDGDGLAGAMLSYDHGQTAVLHLMFLSDRANRNNATYALIFAGLAELERRGCRFANLGGSAGNDDDVTDGLARFKYRWTKSTRSALLCGAVLNPARYKRLVDETETHATSYFPSYRAAPSRLAPQK